MITKCEAINQPINNLQTSATVPKLWAVASQGAAETNLPPKTMDRIEALMESRSQWPCQGSCQLKKVGNRWSLDDHCDAIAKVLGIQLLQNVMRALLETEQGYVQVQKTFLVVVFGVEQIHQHICGSTVILLSDHQPLQTITTKTLLSIPKGLEERLMYLQRSDLEIVHANH